MNTGESPRADESPASGGSLPSWETAVASLLRSHDSAGLARDCYFDGTALQAAERYHHSEEWQAVREYLPSAPGRALDVGAGRGIASYALWRDGWRVSALEPDPSLLVGAGAIRSIVAEVGAAAANSIEVVEAYGERLPFDDAQFDLVLARQSLHHARNLVELVGELHRVLKRGGRLVALRDHVISSPGDLPRFHEVHPLHRIYGGEHAYLLSEYTAAITGAGFKLKKVISPLESPINFAPLTKDGLADEIANRLPAVLGARRIARRVLRSPAVGPLALKLLRSVDHRPGRLYSFVADRDGASMQ